MATKERITGTGFTKRRVEVSDFDSDEEEGKAIRAAFDEVENRFEMIDRVCTNVLEGAGLPPVRKVVVWRGDGSWRDAPDVWDTKMIPGDVSIGDARSQVGDGGVIPPDSEEGYAVRMLDLLGRYRGAVQVGDIDRVGRVALLLGALWREADMKRRVEPPALYGEKFKEGPKAGKLDALGRVLVSILNEIGWDSQMPAIWKRLEQRAAFDDVIDEVFSDNLTYFDGREKLDSRSSKIETVAGRVTLLRKKKRNGII